MEAYSSLLCICKIKGGGQERWLIFANIIQAQTTVVKKPVINM